MERTKQLAEANTALENEIAGHKRAEDVAEQYAALQ